MVETTFADEPRTNDSCRDPCDIERLGERGFCDDAQRDDPATLREHAASLETLASVQRGQHGAFSLLPRRGCAAFSRTRISHIFHAAKAVHQRLDGMGLFSPRGARQLSFGRTVESVLSQHVRKWKSSVGDVPHCLRHIELFGVAVAADDLHLEIRMTGAGKQILDGAMRHADKR